MTVSTLLCEALQKEQYADNIFLQLLSTKLLLTSKDTTLFINSKPSVLNEETNKKSEKPIESSWYLTDMVDSSTFQQKDEVESYVKNWFPSSVLLNDRR